MPRNRWALSALVAGCLAAPAGAPAATTAPEPNDGIHQAKGPLVANETYNASIATDFDDDWFVVHLSGPGTLKVDVTNTSVKPCGTEGLAGSIRDPDGHLLVVETFTDGTAGSMSHAFTSGGTFFVRFQTSNRFDHCTGNYRFKATGPLVDGPVPGPGENTPNASRTPASAYGPLEGAKLYNGRVDAGSESDWFFFYTSGGGEFDVIVTDVIVNEAGGGGCGLRAVLFVGANDDESLVAIRPEPNRHTHLRYNGAAAEHYSLRVDNNGCAGDDYQFRVEPASLLTNQAPPPPPPKDTDGDGVTDDADRCPSVRGPAQGCPDADGDGVADSSDRCRTTAGPGPDGCPPPDRDRDGVPDASDRCVSTAGVPPSGCPAPQAVSTVSAACRSARAARAKAKAKLKVAQRRAKKARTARARKRWRGIRAKRRASYNRAKVRARRRCA